MRLTLAVLAASLALAASAAAAVPDSAWKAVIRDWLADGRFDHRHSCAAVRTAIRHLPADRYRSPVASFRAYAREIC